MSMPKLREAIASFKKNNEEAFNFELYLYPCDFHPKTVERFHKRGEELTKYFVERILPFKKELREDYKELNFMDSDVQAFIEDIMVLDFKVLQQDEEYIIALYHKIMKEREEIKKRQLLNKEEA